MMVAVTAAPGRAVVASSGAPMATRSRHCSWQRSRRQVEPRTGDGRSKRRAARGARRTCSRSPPPGARQRCVSPATRRGAGGSSPLSLNELGSTARLQTCGGSPRPTYLRTPGRHRYRVLYGLDFPMVWGADDTPRWAKTCRPLPVHTDQAPLGPSDGRGPTLQPRSRPILARTRRDPLEGSRASASMSRNATKPG